MIKVAYKDGVKKGSYSIIVKDDTGKIKQTLKVKVSEKELAKAVKLKIQQKYNIVTKQAMVIVPSLSEISGKIGSVDLVGMKDFTASWDDSGKAIMVSYEGDTPLTAADLKTKYSGTLTVVVEGNEGSAHSLQFFEIRHD